MKAKTVENVILIEVKSIEKVISKKGDLVPVIRHVKCLAEKAAKKIFEPIAHIKSMRLYIKGLMTKELHSSV